MKFLKRITKTFFYLFLALDIAIFGAVIYLDKNLNKEFPIKNSDRFSLDSVLPVTAVYNRATADTKSSVDLKIFGIIPFSSVGVGEDSRKVAVLGTPFGMKLYTEGVLVSKLSEIETASGKVCPAGDAGIKPGDYILSANGTKTATNEELQHIVESSAGKEIKLSVKREKKKFSVTLNAVTGLDGSHKIGIWVKDSSAGIGTLTFYSPTTNILCGLGHGVSDDDTGKLLKLQSGEAVEANIMSVETGKVGTPGELKGKFTQNTLGKLRLNGNNGVYSVLTGNIDLTRMVPVAAKREVNNGKAVILCTVSPNGPEEFECEIKLRSGSYNAKTKNMTVTVTDRALLTATGGIVQGMSGSPILQNGRLIGAITHVLVDDPTTGYAIFAENMLETAQSVANSEKLRDAS